VDTIKAWLAQLDLIDAPSVAVNWWLEQASTLRERLG
jgi:hypothetical protein